MSHERNIRLILAFDGTAYHGWQIQQIEPTVQGIVRAAVEKITGGSVNLIGSGRTDAGTHARALVANFVSTSTIPIESLVKGLNTLLPRDIRILSGRLAPRAFHAQRSARSKIYRYQIYRGKVLLPHLAREHFHYPYPLDLDVMARGARIFSGRHDFASLAARSGSAVSNTIRTLYRSELKSKGLRLSYTVEADGFLHHMVRNIVGTLLEAGRGRMTMEDLRALFEKRDRTLAGFTAPAHGLVLVRVRY